jgi:hypothetical protein
VTRVYRIKGDGDYISLGFDNLEQGKALDDFDDGVEPLDPSMVVRMNYGFSDPEDQGVVTDFPYALRGICLVVSARAVDALRPWLDRHGVLLDIALRPFTPGHPAHETVMSMGYKLFVCTTALNALDEERTEFFPFEPRLQHIRAYAFDPTAVADAELFRVAGMWNRMFATDPFVHAVEAHGLTGLRTRAMWSSEDGPLVWLTDALLEFGQDAVNHDAKAMREKRRAMRARIAERGRHGGLHGSLPGDR